MKFTSIIFLIYRLVVAKEQSEIISFYSFGLEPLESIEFGSATKYFSEHNTQTWNITTYYNSALKLYCDINIPWTYNCTNGSLTVSMNRKGVTFCGSTTAYVNYKSDNVFVRYRKQNDAPTTQNVFHCKADSKIMSKSGPVLYRPPRTSWSVQPIDDSSYGISPGKLKTNCPCGWRNKKTKKTGRLAGGKYYEMNEYPFIVQLYDSVTSKPFCGGTIVTPEHVITAYHCLSGYHGNPKRLRVMAGSYDNSKRPPPSLQKNKVRNYIFHKETQMTDGFKMKHDLAVLMMAKPFTFNKNVGPVCFPGPESDFSGQRVRILGWGAKVDKGPMVSKPQKLDAMVLDKLSCSYKCGFVSYSEPTQFCTNSNKTATTLEGDSGGPVIWLDPDTNRFVLIGIVSFGCDDKKVTVYTDVTVLKSWFLGFLTEERKKKLSSLTTGPKRKKRNLEGTGTSVRSPKKVPWFSRMKADSGLSRKSTFTNNIDTLATQELVCSKIT